MILDYRPLRRAVEAYRRAWNLAKEPGVVIETRLPPGKPERRLLYRCQENMHARHLLDEAHVDGTFNLPTQHILIPPLSMGDLAVKFAMKEVGVHEEPWGSNSGKRIHQYQAVTGAYNEAWCASFFWWSWVSAGYHGTVSAGAWDSTDHHGKRVTITQAVPGCGVSFDEGDGHIGMFLARVGSNVKTVDGNTSDEVAVRINPISLIHSICLPTH